MSLFNYHKITKDLIP